MDYLNYIFLTIAIISILMILGFALYTKKFIKTLLSSALIGFIALFALHFTSSFTGFTLEFTPYTFATAGFLGLPGIVGLTIIKMIINM